MGRGTRQLLESPAAKGLRSEQLKSGVVPVQLRDCRVNARAGASPVTVTFPMAGPEQPAGLHSILARINAKGDVMSDSAHFLQNYWAFGK